MLDSFWFCVLLGCLLGFLAGLGVGGGSLLILWLTAARGMDPRIARSINLLFFLPAAGLSSCFRLRQKTIPFRKILPAIVSGCLFAALATWVSRGMELSLLKKLFGGLLLFTGARELFYRPKKA